MYYLKSFDDDGDGRISFEEFLKNFRPVWRFCFYTISIQQNEEELQRRIALRMSEQAKKAL